MVQCQGQGGQGGAELKSLELSCTTHFAPEQGSLAVILAWPYCIHHVSLKQNAIDDTGCWHGN